MNKKHFYLFLTLETCLCILAVWAQVTSELVFTAAVSFPFEQIVGILRVMSRSGTLGNLAAWVLYLTFGALPLVWMCVRLLRRRFHGEDLLLAVLTVLLLWGIYLCINPADYRRFMPAALENDITGKYVFGTVIYSVFISYLILRFFRNLKGISDEQLTRCLKFLVQVIAAVVVLNTVCLSLSGTIHTFQKIKSANTGALPSSLTVTGFFLALRYLAELIPAALLLRVADTGMDLLDALMKDRYGKYTLQSAEKLEHRCRQVILSQVAACLILNLAQIGFAPLLLQADYLLRIPLISIALVMAVMMAAHYFSAECALKKENDLFI